MNFFNLPNPSSRNKPWGLLSLYQKSVLGGEKKNLSEEQSATSA
jgi:hypothetical protein